MFNLEKRNKMKFAFCTCVQLGMSCIEASLIEGFNFDLLITLHDHKSKSKSGRIYLDQIAQEHNTELLKINHINDPGVIEKIKEKEIDWLFIIGWSQIASEETINAPKLGIIGAHPTLLPEGRGRAAIPWAIIKGLKQTGVSFFKMDSGVDTGDILAQQVISIEERETATTLYKKVDEAHVCLFLDTLPKLISGDYSLQKQDESMATYWEGRTPADGEITKDMSVDEVDRLVRATTHPYPGAYYYDVNGNKIVIWEGSSEPLKGQFLICKDGKYYLI
jgi:methionyl-tRNA formyltransferase